VNKEVPFPQWVPAEVKKEAKSISEDEAIAALGEWAAGAVARPSGRAPACFPPAGR
jgi:hypothetical protein